MQSLRRCSGNWPRSLVLQAAIRVCGAALLLAIGAAPSQWCAADTCCYWIPAAHMSGGPVGIEVTVSIQGTNCPVSTVSATVGPGGATGELTVMTSSNLCAWTATGSVPWLHITAGSSGTGTGSVSFAVDANDLCSSRTGTLTVAGQTVALTQTAIAIEPASVSPAADGGTGTVTVATASGCSWTAQSSAGWFRILSGASGTGDGSVRYAVDPNPGCDARSAVLTIGGQAVTVHQPSVPGGFVVSPASISPTADGGTGTVTVASASGCSWTAQSSAGWLHILSGASGTGNCTVFYAVDPNPGCDARSAVLTIGGQAVAVHQPSVPGVFVVSPASASFGGTGGSGTVTITTGAGCIWTGRSNANWVHIVAGNSSSGNGAISYLVDTNLTCAARAGTLTVAGQTVSVTQTAGSGSLAVTPASVSFGTAGGSGTVEVNATGPCPWTAASSVAWVQLVGRTGGSSSGSVVYSVSPNATTASRSGVIGIAGKTVTVTQDGCAYAWSPAAAAISAAGGTNTVFIESTAPCPWIARSSDNWITILGSSSGVRSGSVTYAIAPNAAAATRIGSITGGGQVHSVTQAGNAPPQISVAPVAPIIWPAATVDLHATVTDDGAPSGLLSLHWAPVSGTGVVALDRATAADTAATFSAPGTYRLRLTASDGVATASQDATVLVAQRPQVTALPAPTNALLRTGSQSIVAAGADVAFAMGVTDPDGRSWHCAWTFGDGTTSADCTPTHVFSNCGPQLVTVLIDDGIATVASTTTVSVACALEILKLQTNVSFARDGADSCRLTARFSPGDGFQLADGSPLTLDIGGAQAPFVFDSRGRGQTPRGTGRLVFDQSQNSWTLTAALTHGTWREAWAAHGLTNATVANVTIAMPVTLLVNTNAFAGQHELNYSARKNRTGNAK